MIEVNEKEGCSNAYHLYVIRVKNKKRREVFEQLRGAGIGVNVHYIPVYKHPYYQKHGYDKVCCPNVEQYYDECISLPMYPALTDEEQRYGFPTACRGTGLLVLPVGCNYITRENG